MDFRIFYEEFPEDRKVIERWLDVTMDSTQSCEFSIHYNSGLDTILSRDGRIEGESERIHSTEYRYKGNKLTEIGPDHQGLTIYYSYGKTGQLQRVVKYLYGRPFKVEFVSSVTGLVDSVLRIPDKMDSVDFEEFDLNDIYFEKADMTYYSYF